MFKLQVPHYAQAATSSQGPLLRILNEQGLAAAHLLPSLSTAALVALRGTCQDACLAVNTAPMAIWIQDNKPIMSKHIMALSEPKSSLDMQAALQQQAVWMRQLASSIKIKVVRPDGPVVPDLLGWSADSQWLAVHDEDIGAVKSVNGSTGRRPYASLDKQHRGNQLALGHWVCWCPTDHDYLLCTPRYPRSRRQPSHCISTVNAATGAVVAVKEVFAQVRDGYVAASGLLCCPSPGEVSMASLPEELPLCHKNFSTQFFFWGHHTLLRHLPGWTC